MKNKFLILLFLKISCINLVYPNFYQTDSCIAYGGLDPQILFEQICIDEANSYVTFYPTVEPDQEIPITDYGYGLIVIIGEETIFKVSPTNEIDVSDWFAFDTYKIYGISYHQSAYPLIESSQWSSINELLDSAGIDEMHCFSLSENYKTVETYYLEVFNLTKISCQAGEILNFEFMGNNITAGWGYWIIPLFTPDLPCNSVLHLNVIGDLNSNTYFSSDALCLGDTLNLNASIGAEHEWNGPNGFSSDSQIIQIPHLEEQNFGQYNCNTTKSNGCSFVEYFDIEPRCIIDTIELFVGEEITLAFDSFINNNDSCIDINENIAISFFFNDSLKITGAEIGEELICFEGIINGSSKLITYFVNVSVPTSNLEILKPSGINLYPNPVNSVLKIDPLGKTVRRLYIYNIHGILEVEKKLDSISNQFEYNIEFLNSGLHFIKLEFKDYFIIYKFVKT